MDGFAVMERLREQPYGAPRTILMLNPQHRAGDMHRSEELGILGCLLKPLTRAELLETIVKVLPAEAGAPPPVCPPATFPAGPGLRSPVGRG